MNISKNIPSSISSFFEAQKSCADVSVLCSTTGTIFDVVTSSPFYTLFNQGSSIFDLFPLNNQDISDYLAIANSSNYAWFKASFPNKQHLLDWRISTIELDTYRFILIQGHEGHRKPLTELDPTTGLPLRDFLFSEISQLPLTRGSVVCFDINNFKEINQLYGVNYGNAVLGQVATLIKDTFLEAILITRCGDDQFCVITPVENANKEIEKVLSHLDHPLYALDQLIKISLSVGCCVFPSITSTLEQAVAGSFTALHAYKKSEEKQLLKNWDFTKKDLQAIHRKQTLKELLGPAINNGEFYLLYQPIVDQDKKILGLEALMRWKSPTEGLISPAEFIPVAEQSHQHILTLGSWALRYACEEIAKLGSAFSHIKISVNVSPLQFKKPDFVQDVRNILVLTGIAPHRLQLEITEGILVDNPKASALILKMLKDLGVTIAIDDFGVGFSSLSYLKTFSIDTLKIDKSFVDEITNSKKEEAICASIVDMTKRLQLKCTAEGIESESQYALLKKLGCTTFQGYLFGKPQLLQDIFK